MKPRISFDDLVNIAKVAAENGYKAMPGGHLLFAFDMEDFGIEPKESVKAYAEALFCLRIGKQSSTMLTY